MLVLLQGLAPNQHVIHVDEAVVEAVQHLVHEALKCLDCIPHAKWKVQELPQPKWSDDCGLGHVARPDRYLVKTFAEVQLREDCAPLQPGCQIRNVGARVEVRLRLKVEHCMSSL